MNLAPIILFVYNRPWHTRQTLEALSKNFLAEKSHLYIYADGPKKNASPDQFLKINEVRKLIREKKWCGKVEIIESNSNAGLAPSVIKGVTEIVNKFGKIIVLEDDLVVSTGFLKYMNEALALYENENRVMHVSGYMFPVKNSFPETFFLVQATCWGWGTWKRAWKLFENNAATLTAQIKQKDIRRFNINNTYDHYSDLVRSVTDPTHSWAIKWHAKVFILNALCLHPKQSLVRNIGFDCSGEHCKTTHIYSTQKVAKSINVFSIPITESFSGNNAIEHFLHSQKIASEKVNTIYGKGKIILRTVKENLVGFFKTRKHNASLHISDKELVNQYWSDHIDMLENWGNDNVWNEIQMFLAPIKGKVLDIACGTGVTIGILQKFNNLELYGCDISDVVIKKCIEKGIPSSKLIVCDAAHMPFYKNDFFDYSYSIGSLEYLSEEKLQEFVRENRRIVKNISFHMVPVSKNNINQGSVNHFDSTFLNNSTEWWCQMFKAHFDMVLAVSSGWKNDISNGKWLICFKNA